MSISFLKHWLNEHYQQSGPGFVPGSWPHGCTLANKLRTRQDRVQEKWPSSNIMNSNRVHKLLQNCLRNGDVELLTLDTRTCNFHLDSDSRSYKETVKKSITNYNHPNWTELKHHLFIHSCRRAVILWLPSLWSLHTINLQTHMLHTQFTSQPELGQGQIKLD